MKPIVFSTYGENYNFELDKSIEIYIDVFPSTIKTVDKRVFVAMEPDIISRISDQIIARQDEFDYVLTFDKKILEGCKNSVLFEFGTKWVDFEKYSHPQKMFSVSTVCGHKQISKNHILRKKLWYKQDKLKIPTDFYISQYGGVEVVNNNKVLGESKFPLFDSMFFVCIENISQDYYFSEKLIDCLLCKSVPIYLGCTNIGNYFNMDGIIIANSVEDIINSCNSLTEEDYRKKNVAIEENYNKALSWIDYPKRLENKLKEIIK